MYTSIEAVFSRLTIPHDQYEEDDVIEWAMQALDIINVKKAYAQKTLLLTVSNHKVQLPPGIVQIEVVALPLGDQALTADEVEDLTQQEIDYINKQNVDRIQGQGIINNYNLFIRTDLFDDTFVIMRASQSPFMTKMHCTTCPNFNSNCDYEYNIDHNMVMTTSFESGNVCIGYLEHITNEDGQFMIPDSEDLIQFLANYVMAKFWEVQWNIGDGQNGSERKHRLYLTRAQNLMAKARGIFITKGFNFKDYDNIVYKNIKWANSGHIFNQKIYKNWTRIK